MSTPSRKGQKRPAKKPAEPLRLVGIGASAGGLEALRELLPTLPPSRAFSYVVAQHVSPTHTSMLGGLLAPVTRLSVVELLDGQVPEPATIYITPPNKDVILKEGKLRLTAPKEAIGPKPSVSLLFQSLAEQVGEQAIGIILSGTSSDGSTGVRAIKAAGGVVMVQDPETSKYDGMPRSAINTGSIDLVLPPDKMGEALKRLLRPEEEVLDSHQLTDTEAYQQISGLVRRFTAFNLDNYKSATVHRRVARRMSIVGAQTPQAYIRFIQEDHDEAKRLVRDTFIGVTSFFRDEGAYHSLNELIGQLVRERQGGDVIRCWVPACSSGEEVYSIAMLFEEALKNQDKPSLQYVIFASDLDEAAIEQARSGLYPLHDFDQVPQALRDRYTMTLGDHCRIIKSIRNSIVFARQNVIGDPPFARMDLISCRNLLIYFTADTQKQVLQIFHYALRQGGYLLLGKSESVEQNSDLFHPLSQINRLYQRQEGTSHLAMPLLNNGQRQRFSKGRETRNGSGGDYLRLRALEALSRHFAPPSLVINRADNVVQFHGDLKPFLGFPQGRAEMNLFYLLDGALRAELRALIFRARRDHQEVRGGGIVLPVNDQPSLISLQVIPLDSEDDELLLISFLLDDRPVAEPGPIDVSRDERAGLLLGELEQELESTRAHLNILVEELLTVNEEIQIKSSELEVTASDLLNVMESIDFPLIVVDETLCVTQYNSACMSVVQMEGPIDGQSLNSMAWRLAVTDLGQEAKQVLQSGTSTQRLLASGDGQYYNLVLMPYRSDRQQVVGLVLLFEDVTEQHRANQRLREREQQLSRIMDSTHAGSWEWNVQTGEARFNERWAEIVGYDLEQLEPVSINTWIDLAHPEDLKRSEEQLQKHFADELEFYQCEVRVRHRQGHWVWVLDHGKVQSRSEDGRPLWMSGIHLDISERKQTEVELAEYRQRLQQLVAERTAELEQTHRQLTDTLFAMDRAGIGIHWVEEETGRILYANNHAASMLGYQVEDLLRMKVTDIDPYVASRTLAQATEALFKEGVGQFETVQKTREGELIPVEVIGYRLPAQEHEPSRLITFIIDISRRKEAEQALVQARQVAEDASLAKSTFLANMSHEIRTPMNAVIGMTTLALHTHLDDRQRNYVEKAQRSAQSLLGLLNDILDFSKIESGKLDVEAVPFSPHDVIDNISNVLGSKCEEEGIDLTFDIGSDVPTDLLGDPLRLTQILLNLGGNAVKFTESGQCVQIGLYCKQQSETEVELLCHVCDTGLGMSDEVQQRLFQPFAQADSSITRNYGGTGLGLSISKRLVELLGGRIWVESAPGEGSTFFFTARFARLQGAPGKSDAPRQVTAEGISAAISHLAGARLLLVEDNAINQELAVDLLSHYGMQVTTADDGQQALDRLEQETFDGVLMDCQMPVMDGYTATLRIRRQKRFKDLPIIAMTANVMKGDREKVLAAGMNGFIPKPLDLNQMLLTLAHWITPEPGAVAAPAPNAKPPKPEAPVLPPLAGVDTEKGVSSLREKPALYRDLLLRFLNEQRNFEDAFRALQAQGDDEGMTFAAHGIKGVAGNLGITEVYAAAEGLEQACRGEPDAIEPNLLALLQALHPVLQGLQVLEPREAVETGSADVEVDVAHLQPLIHDLRVLLRNSDYRAVNLAERFIETLSGSVYHQQAGLFGEQVHNYDFDLALEQLERLVQALEAQG
jgi:two-component system CheB/CheR fusion protein